MKPLTETPSTQALRLELSHDLGARRDVLSRRNQVNELPGCLRFGLGGRANDT